MTKKILFCGPIPLPGAKPLGGYETCNRRTIDALRARGAAVDELRYPQPRGGALSKLRGYWGGFAGLLRQLAPQRDALLHVTGLYKQFILPEWLMLRRARKLGIATVYDIRAGSMFTYYQRYGPLYRWLFRRALQSADAVMIEGMEYASFVETVTGKAAFYLPNHIGAAGIPARPPEGSGGAALRLIYVGRVTREKGVETALLTARTLAARGLACEIAIAGPGDAKLMASLRADYADLNVEWLGSLQSSEVLAQFGRAHFFLFPTRHTGEGHSNALTEAMAMGCVPVASANGFNRSVIGETGAVLALDADAGGYADAVLTLWNGASWAAHSAAAMLRTKQLFSTEQAVARLQARYTEVWKEFT
ncbi:glycosyltransferase involved in cell wall biosynthesis [Janthinobacterium sp. CG_23.3]|uniref:glycosyltransferase family 4 protein n=1 Tax=Janthinobacterium sp. CG_23.3 TaxID=3349634 RepID=UPI0038D44B0D